MVEITDELSRAQVESELRDSRLAGGVTLAGMEGRVRGTARAERRPDGYGGHHVSYTLEEL